jgi:hypothetical protein
MMIKVSIVVHSGAASFQVAVRADSVERALSLAQRLHAGSDVRVKFPIDPGGFFVKDPATQVEMVELAEKIAA